MAEPTNTELLDALTNLSLQVSQLTTIIQDISSILTIHRQQSEERSTNLDVGLRGELALVRAHVDAFQPQLDGVRAQQTVGDQAVADLQTMLDALRVETATMKSDIANMNPKLDEVRAKQDEIMARQNEPAPA